MSEDIDQKTMGALAAGTPQNNVVESEDGDMLLSGTVAITKDAAGLERAVALRDAVMRTLSRLAAAGFGALVLLVMLASTPGAAADLALRPTWAPRAASDRAWPQLNKAQLTALNAVLRQIKSARVEIYCGGSFCRGLAEDLDEAFESAGHDSNLEVPMFDIGKGLGISPSDARTRKIAQEIAIVTKGLVILKVLVPTDAKGKPVDTGGKIVIALGRKKAPGL
jgi:hypothetical protein